MSRPRANAFVSGEPTTHNSSASTDSCSWHQRSSASASWVVSAVDLVVQAQGFGGIGRGHELTVRLPLLIVEAGNRSLEIGHLLANLPLVPPGGAAVRSSPVWPPRRRLASPLACSRSPSSISLLTV